MLRRCRRVLSELTLPPSPPGQLEPVEGLLPTLLQLVSPSSSSSPVVRLATAIYLKNRIKSSWRQPLEPSIYASPATVAAAQKASTFVKIPPTDRQSVKSNLIPLYAALAADPDGAKVKEQVGEALSRVIECDFPEQWPSLVDEIKVMLAGDEGQVEAGLRATMEVFNSMRYAAKDENGTTLVHLTSQLLPLVLPLGQKVLASTPTDAASLTTQGTLLRLVLKAYKNSIVHTLTAAHQAPDSLIPWGTLLLSVVSHSVPAALLPEDPDNRERHPWARSKKWACFALNRLFTRYGNPAQLPKNLVEQYGAFASRFTEQFAPEILKAYLAAVERMVAQGEWFPKKGKYHLLCFFEEWCVVAFSSRCNAPPAHLDPRRQHQPQGHVQPPQAPHSFARRALCLPARLHVRGGARALYRRPDRVCAPVLWRRVLVALPFYSTRCTSAD